MSDTARYQKEILFPGRQHGRDRGAVRCIQTDRLQTLRQQGSVVCRSRDEHDGGAAALVHTDPTEPTTREELDDFLVDYGMRQLSVVLTPPLMQPRRLVIGEVTRFPELARTLYEKGPQIAISVLAAPC